MVTNNIGIRILQEPWGTNDKIVFPKSLLERPSTKLSSQLV